MNQSTMFAEQSPRSFAEGLFLFFVFDDEASLVVPEPST
jgi:hypothetical protein